MAKEEGCEEKNRMNKQKRNHGQLLIWLLKAVVVEEEEEKRGGGVRGEE